MLHLKVHDHFQMEANWNVLQFPVTFFGSDLDKCL
jgi:hypothetical protein